MAEILDPAPRTPRFKWIGAIVIFGLILLNAVAICVPSLLPWRQPVGLSLDIIGAILLVIPDVPYFWRRLYGGRLEWGLEKLDETYDIPGYLHSPRKSDDQDPGHETYTSGFDEILDALRRSFSAREEGPEPLRAPDIDWDKVDQLSFEPKMVDQNGTKIREERFFLRTWPSNAVVDDFNADWIRWHINRVIDLHKRRIRRLGLGLLIIGFTQQLLISIPPIGLAARIYELCITI